MSTRYHTYEGIDKYKNSIHVYDRKRTMMMMIMTLSRERNRNINNINSNRNNDNNSSTIILIAMITSIIVVKSNPHDNNRIYNNINRFRFLFFTYTTNSFSLSFLPITKFSRSLVLSFADRRNKILVAHHSAESKNDNVTLLP